MRCKQESDAPGTGLPIRRVGDSDIITLAKGLAEEFRLARLSRADPQAASSAGMHGTTFGGNPISAAAGLAVLDAIESDGLLDRAVEAGERLTQA